MDIELIVEMRRFESSRAGSEEYFNSSCWVRNKFIRLLVNCRLSVGKQRFDAELRNCRADSLKESGDHSRIWLSLFICKEGGQSLCELFSVFGFHPKYLSEICLALRLTRWRSSLKQISWLIAGPQIMSRAPSKGKCCPFFVCY